MTTGKVKDTKVILAGDPVLQEREALGAITPGMLCYERSAAVGSAPAGRWDGAIALDKDELGQGISGVYATDAATANAYAEGDMARYAVVGVGQDFNAWVLAQGSDITEGDLLEISATNGILQKYSEGTPVAVAMESLAISGLTVNTMIAARRTIPAAEGPVPLVYRALLSQSSTAAPVATVLENTLGEVPTFSRDAAGEYTLDTVAAIFTISKVAILLGSVGSGAVDEGVFLGYAARESDTSISIFTYSGSAGLDDILQTTAIEILVYP
jgi:hypothetical protein